MPKRIGLVAASAVVLATTGCGGEERPVPSWVSPSSAGPARLEKITSACELLSAETVVDILGGRAPKHPAPGPV